MEIGWKLAGLAVLFSRQILNGSQDFFLFNTLIFVYFLKYETIETHARAFLTLIILAIAWVLCVRKINYRLQKMLFLQPCHPVDISYPFGNYRYEK